MTSLNKLKNKTIKPVYRDVTNVTYKFQIHTVSSHIHYAMRQKIVKKSTLLQKIQYIYFISIKAPKSLNILHIKLNYYLYSQNLKSLYRT